MSFVEVDTDFDKAGDRMGVVDYDTVAAAFADTVTNQMSCSDGPTAVLPDLLLCPCHLGLFHRYFSLRQHFYLHLYLPDYYHLPVVHEVYDPSS